MSIGFHRFLLFLSVDVLNLKTKVGWRKIVGLKSFKKGPEPIFVGAFNAVRFKGGSSIYLGKLKERGG